MYRQRGLIITSKAQHNNKARVASKKNEIQRYTNKMDEIIQTYLAATSKIIGLKKQFDFILTKLNLDKRNDNSNCINGESILSKFGESLNKIVELVNIFDKEYNLFVGRIIDGSHMPTSFSINHHIWAYELFIAWLTRGQEIVMQNGNLHNIRNGKTRIKTKTKARNFKRRRNNNNIDINDTNIKISKQKRLTNGGKKQAVEKCAMCNHHHCRCISNSYRQGKRNESFVDLFNNCLNNVNNDLNELLNNFDVFFNDSLMLTSGIKSGVNCNETNEETIPVTATTTQTGNGKGSDHNDNNNKASDSLLHSLKTMDNVQLIIRIYETHNAMIDFQNDMIELKDNLDNKIYKRLSVFQTKLTFNFKKQVIVAKVDTHRSKRHRHRHHRRNDTNIDSRSKNKHKSKNKSKNKNKSTHSSQRTKKNETKTTETDTVKVVPATSTTVVASKANKTGSVQVVKKIGDFNGIDTILSLFNNS